MAAPTNAANVKKTLANSEPSTHGTKRTYSLGAAPSAIEPKAELALRILSRLTPSKGDQRIGPTLGG